MKYSDRPWLKWYDEGVEPEIVIPEMTLVDRYNEAASEFPDHVAFHFMGIATRFRELSEQADRFASFLKENGFGPGDVVGICAPNIPQYLIAFLGILKAGCAASGVSPLLTTRELAHQVNDCNAKCLVTLDAIFEHRLAGAADQFPRLKLIVTTGLGDFMPAFKRVLGTLLRRIPTGKVHPLPGKQVVQFKEILAKYPAEDPKVSLTPDDHCLIQYTGGTTGLPKGTILTHRNVVANTYQMVNWTGVKRGEVVALSGFPFFHLAGLTVGMLALTLGGTQILVPNPRDTKHMAKEFRRYRPSFLVNVPSLYMMLIEEPLFRDADFSNLELCFSGASPYPAESIKEFEAVTGKRVLMEGFGMTETIAVVISNPRHNKRKIGSVGVPISGTGVRIVDLETGTKDVPVGEEGEVIARGPQVMKGYLNKPEETAIALRDHDGETWLHTGDVARMDEDGFFFIVDRAKDMLSVGGFKVFSREIEEKLYELDAIDLCAIVGLPNPDRPGSEIVKLVAQLRPGYKEKDHEKVKADILAFSKENLAPYKIPKVIEFVDEVPLTPVGKVDKKALR